MAHPLILFFIIFVISYFIFFRWFRDVSVTGYSKTLFFDFINQLEKRMSQKSLSEVEEIEGKKFHIIIHGGEANPEVYRKIEDKLNSLSEDIKRKNIKIALFVGPRLAIEENKADKIDKEGKVLDKVSDDEFWELHPLLRMVRRYPHNITVFYKIDDTFYEENHFIYADGIVYVEALHDPLKEGEATIVENPNPIVKRTYKKKIELLKKGLKDKIIIPITSSDTETAKKTIRFSTFKE